MKRIGLTGGIASGKSSAARLLAQWGVPVIDADRIAREVVEPGSEGLAAIAARWPEVVREGVLDRKALARVVFPDPAERRALEGILHPLIRAETERRFAALEAAGEPVAVYEAALLFETGHASELDAVILISAPREVQHARLMQRDGLDAAEAAARIDAQWPLERKEALASHVVVNDGHPDHLRVRLRRTWEKVLADLGLPPA